MLHIYTVYLCRVICHKQEIVDYRVCFCRAARQDLGHLAVLAWFSSWKAESLIKSFHHHNYCKAVQLMCKSCIFLSVGLFKAKNISAI